MSKFENDFEHFHHQPHYHPPHDLHWGDDDDNTWLVNVVVDFLSLFS